MKKLTFIAAILSASPCAAQQVIDTSVNPLPVYDVAEVISIMSHDSTNPIAVQFRNIQRSTDPTQTSIYCGEINLPNRVGGYYGFSKFVINIKNRKNYIASQDYANYDSVSYVVSCQPKD